MIDECAHISLTADEAMRAQAYIQRGIFNALMAHRAKGHTKLPSKEEMTQIVVSITHEHNVALTLERQGVPFPEFTN